LIFYEQRQKQDPDTITLERLDILDRYANALDNVYSAQGEINEVHHVLPQGVKIHSPKKEMDEIN